MSEGLGLLIDDQHEQTINSLTPVPVSFGAGEDVPSCWVPPLVVENQGRTNSCAGHMEALACAHSNYVATGEVLRFSRRFAYITSQSCGGFAGEDGGTSITSTLIAATKYGCCLELDCPFQESYSQRLPQQAYENAANHKHHGDTRYDCRSLETAIQWATDHRCVCIGTRWMSGQRACTGIETKKVGTSGSFLGYHARLVIGWDTLDGVLCPVVQNSHGVDWGNRGRSTVTPDLWEHWQGDANFFALGFNRISEVEPKRRSWNESKPGDVC